MSCLRIALILGAVLGAVGTEAVAQSTHCVLKVAARSVSIGEVVPFSLSNPVPGPMDFALYVARSTGTCMLTVGSSSLFLPLDNTLLLVAQGSSAVNRCAGSFIVPALPAITGLMPRAAAVTWSAGTLRVSAAMPWGPILEDSLQ
ncbi:MAG: hypothetical protein EXS14_05970 [Planctomycetes bacterium]|nr:hypothetical protein [Planctomycetota bacterium]